MLDNIPTPSINKMIWWHQKFMGKVYLKEDGNLNPLLIMETGAPARYGLHSLEEIVRTSVPTALMGWQGVGATGRGIKSKI